jgi:hypothetical protein
MATLHFKSPVYMQRGHGLLFHKSPFYMQPGHGQSGAGIGSIFKSMFRFLAPAAKKTFNTVAKVGKQLLSNSTVRDVLDTVKQEAIKTSVNAVANAIAGNPVAEPIQADIAEARERVANAVRHIQPGSGKKRSILQGSKGGKRRKNNVTPEPDIFTD